MSTTDSTHAEGDTQISTTTVATPIGELTIGASDDGIRFVLWDREASTHDASSTARRDAHLAAARQQLGEYFEGRRTEFDVELDAVGTAFQHAAWDALRRIPFGETVSYGHQATMLGDVKKSRAVGAANGKNPIPIIVPCHRVIGANGSLTGFAGGLSTKAWLLDHERLVLAGVPVEAHPH